VGEGIDEERAVQQGSGADEKTPHENLRARGAEGGPEPVQQCASTEEQRAENRWDDHIEAIEEDEFRIFREVAHGAVVRGEVFARGHPANMGPPKAAEAGGVDVILLVGMLVVVAMNGGPPERAALDGGIAERGEDELAETARLKAAMGKVAMIEAGDGEHPHKVECRGHDGGRPTKADGENEETTRVQKDERNGALPLKTIGLFPRRGRAAGEIIGVEPLPNLFAERGRPRGNRIGR
jgi:hypothetical protein